jgi:hypothetical protein
VARAPQREQKFNAGILNVALTTDARGPLERHACAGIFLQGVAAVRGFLAGVVRNKLGKTLISEKSGEERAYRVVMNDVA